MDAVHNDTYKIAGGLSRGIRNGNGETDSDIASEDEGQTNSRKKKVKFKCT